MLKKGELYYPTKEFQKRALLKSEKIYKKAAKDPLKFWEKAAQEILWRKKWKKVFEHQPPYFKWFLEGKLNITESCLDRHQAKKKDKMALIWEPESLQEQARYFTYEQLFKEVNKFVNGLKKIGVQKGDRVGIYLPMIPEIVIAILACARIGAVHSVVFSAFSPAALRVRLEDTQAKVLITADGYFRRGQVINLKQDADAALTTTGENIQTGEGLKVEKVVVVKRAGQAIQWQSGRDLWWHELTEKESDWATPEVMDSEDLLFILYTSGSTGKPKGCCMTCAGYAVQAQLTGKWIFDWQADDIFWSTADVGWITGHSYSVYSPLLNGITFLLFEGAPDWPSPERWCQTIEKHKITTFYTAPTAIRMFEKYGTDLVRKYRFESLQLLGSVGEPIDEDAWHWYFREVGKERCPLVDTWWQTETGGILITSLPGIGPFRPAFAGLPFPAVKFGIFDDEGKPCPAAKEGNLVLLPPFSPGLLRDIYKNPKKYLETYWSQYGTGVYLTSDAAYKDENGLIRIVGRIDDVLKVSGHRVTTGELENAVAKHPDITEAAVIGIPDPIKGEVPAIFAIAKKERVLEELKKEILEQIKKEIGPIALPKEIYLVDDLPKTRSGKIMRRILRKLFLKEDTGDISTLANPESVEKIKSKIFNPKS